MKRLKVMTVIGTRPEAIKFAPLVKVLQREQKVETIVCATAQHREMLDQVLDQFSIMPDYDLDIMKHAQTPAYILSRALEGIDEVLAKVQPDIVLVQGDTTTSFAAALAAFHHKVPLGHVEAGLRSFKKYAPFPEEMNRKLTGQIADIHFAPTHINKENLLKENIRENVYVTGNTVIDALKQMVKDTYTFDCDILNRLCGREGRRLILLTAHRRENLGQPLKEICHATKAVAVKYDDVDIVYPMHPNPAVRSCVTPLLSDVDNIYLMDPLDVSDMHNLLNRCYLVMTDSGGLQEEAAALEKPVVVLRKETERPEICHAGKAVLAGTDEEDIFRLADNILNDGKVYAAMQKAANPYGDGKASERIVKAILYWAGFSDARPADFMA